MTIFSNYIKRFERPAMIFRDVMARNAITITDGRFMVHKDRMSQWEFDHMPLESLASKIEVYLIGTALSRGPKVFCPRDQDFQILAQTDLNIDFEDYDQPFDTVVIEIPAAGRQLVTCPQAGEWVYGSLQPAQHTPIFTIIHKIGSRILALVAFNSDVSIKVMLAPCEKHKSIEDQLDSVMTTDLWSGTLETSENEWQIVKDTLRSCLNYCLLVDELGHRRIGHANPDYAERLRTSRHESNAKMYKALPVYYDLKQQVKLYRTVGNVSELSEPTGRTMPPHHRRGHYRMQRYGKDLSLKKKIRILPVFVNKYLFLGDLSNSETIYA